MSPKKKGALAMMLIGLKPKGASSSKEPDDDELGGPSDTDKDDVMPMSGHEAAFESFANASGIPPEKRGRAMAALKSFVQSCMREYGPEKE